MSPSTLGQIQTTGLYRQSSVTSMSPTPASPVPKPAQPQRASTDSSSDGIRKRVCKACDRCRLKKSKCDGSNPCSRCKADNAICVFGERKKSHDKVYPKGYVEMLEQQQSQLVNGLQEMYKRLREGQPWPGPTLSEAHGHPLTHDILAALDLLETKGDGSGDVEGFEEDCQKLQSKLLAEGAPYVQRRGSISSESDHSQHGNHSRSGSQATPQLTTRAPVFKDGFTFTPSPSPLSQSPGPRAQQQQSFSAPPRHSPLHTNSPLINDPQLYQAEWAATAPYNNPEAILRSRFAMQVPSMSDSLPDGETIMDDGWEDQDGFDLSMAGFPLYPQQPTAAAMQDLSGSSLDPMELDLSKYIQVAT